MENKNLKNILVAAGLAVFAGVLTLGVNAAFGSVDAPTQNPADASLHSPRFNNVEVEGYLQNNTATVDPSINLPVVINDALSVYNGLALWGDARINGDLILNPDMGTISVPDGRTILPFNTNLFIGGKGYIENPEANSITIDGIKGEISAEEGTLTIPTALDIKGPIKNSKTTMTGLGGDSSIETPLPVEIGDSLDVNYDLTVDGGLTVSGAATADRFGTYTKRSSSDWYPTISAGNIGTKTVSCVSGEDVISCGVDDYSDQKDLNIIDINIDPANNSCTVLAHNKSAGDRWFKAIALCLNPGL